MHYRIREYVDLLGRSPFRQWLKSLAVSVQIRIQARIFRFEQGNLGDIKSVGKGVFEARMPFGPGFRLYFSITENDLILLLIGGDKSTQKKDIKKAKDYLNNFKEQEDAQKK